MKTIVLANIQITKKIAAIPLEKEPCILVLVNDGISLSVLGNNKKRVTTINVCLADGSVESLLG